MNLQANGHYSTNFETSSRLGISTLNPRLPNSEHGHIEASVALVWPYSSSSKTLSLLLVEKDVRLRKHKGQVKVTFQKECAKEVAKTRVGIGDVVKLSLKDVSWNETGETVSTPGKKVNWDLNIHRRVKIEVNRKDQNPISLEFYARSPSPVQLSSTRARLSHEIVGPYAAASTPLPHTPVFRTPKRLSSGSFVDASLSPFADEDGYISGRGRKRTKFARGSGSWQLLEDGNDDDFDGQTVSPMPQQSPAAPLSPVSIQNEEGRDEDVVELVTSSSIRRVSPPTERLSVNETVEVTDSHHGGTDDKVMGSMAPPPYYRLQPELRSIGTLKDASYFVPSFASPTPVLRPIPSPQLPLVSPFMQQPESLGSYFPSMDASTSTDVHQDMTTAPVDQYGHHAQETFTSNEYMNEIASTRIDVSVNHSAMDMTMHANEREPPSIRTNEQDIPANLMENDPTSQQIQSPYDPQQLFTHDIIDLDALQEHIEREAAGSGIPDMTSQVVEDSSNFEGPDNSGTVIESFDLPLEPVTTSELNEHLGMQTAIDQLSPILLEEAEVNHDGEHRSSSREEIPRLDGTELTYQTESERLRVREELEQNKRTGTPSEPVEISSDEDEDEVALETTQEQLVLEDPKPPLVDHDKISPPIDRGSLSADTAADILYDINTSSSTPEAVETLEEVIKPLVVDYEEMMTPIATQEEEGAYASLITERVQHDHDHNLLPTPVPTQTYQSSQPSLPTEESIAKEPELPEISSSKETGHSRHTSGRLTRRSFHSDTVANDYFTPRRSTRARRAPSRDMTDGIPSDIIPSSPSKIVHAGQSSPVQKGQRTSDDADQSQQLNSVPSAHGVTTSLSYYPHLGSIHEFFGQEVDVLAVCTADSTEPEKATSGPKDYNTTLHLADSSFTGNTTITGQMFRPRKSALPVVKRGDVVMLRNMKVQTHRHKPELLSTDSSAWAVFGAGEESVPAISNGPPVEYGEAEARIAKQLSNWWVEFGQHTYSNLSSSKAEQDDIAKPGPSSAARKRPRRPRKKLSLDTTELTGAANSNGEAENEPATTDLTSPMITRSQRRKRGSFNKVAVAPEGTATTLLTASTATAEAPGQPIDDEADDQLFPLPSTFDQSHQTGNLSPTMSTRSAPRRSQRSRQRSESIVHELRDGTKYTDDANKKAKGNAAVHELRRGVRYVDK